MQEGPENEHVAAVSHEALRAVIGTRVREARKRAKLTQADLATAIGSGQSYIFQIEAGEANITLKTLVRLADAVGLSPTDLLPSEHSKRIAEKIHLAMQDLNRVSVQLRQIYELVADDPSVSVPGVPPES